MKPPASTSPDERRPAHCVALRRVVTVADEAVAARYARGCVILIDDDADVLSALAALLQLEHVQVQVESVIRTF